MGFSKDARQFQVAVSVCEEHVIGMGATKQKQERVIYYYAEKKDDQGVFIQALNHKDFPSGEKTLVSDEEFFAKYRPEPLYFYNRVKVAMDAVEAGLEKGQKALENGHDKVAEKEFKKALAVDEENVRAIFGLGTAYLSSENKDAALGVFEKIMSLDMSFSPRHKHMFNDFGMRLRKGGMFEQALQYYEKAAAQLKGEDENLYFNVGRAYYDLKRYQEAGESLRKALSANPDFVEAKKFLAVIDKCLAGDAAQCLEPTPAGA